MDAGCLQEDEPVSRKIRSLLLITGCFVIGSLFFIISRDEAATAAGPQQEGKALADAPLEQWKRKNPERVADWVAEE
jgi:hypothetical protein